MFDNELYQAVMEGRVPLRFEVEQDPKTQEYVAKHDQFGIDVEHRDQSIRMAQEGAREQVLEKIRSGTFNVRYA